MGRVEWLKWVVRYGRRKTRARQVGMFAAFEVYYQFCKLRGYPVDHFLKTESRPAGKYILIWPSLPLSIRLIDKIFPFGAQAHARYAPYTLEAAEELRNTGRRIELLEISYKLGVS